MAEINRDEANHDLSKLKEKLAASNEEWAKKLANDLAQVTVEAETHPQKGVSSSELNSGGPEVKERANKEAQEREREGSRR